MSSINFEQDQQKVMSKTENIQSLADQVERLDNLQRQIETDEGNLKQKKKNLDISFVRFLEVELPKMQFNLVVEMYYVYRF